MQDEDPELAAFQIQLLEALHLHDDAAAIFAALKTAECEPFADYISSFEPEMLEVAALLVKKWGRKVGPSPADALHKMPH